MSGYHTPVFESRGHGNTGGWITGDPDDGDKDPEKTRRGDYLWNKRRKN